VIIMKLLKVDTVDEAREKILERVKSWALKTEAVSLDEGLGRVLAQDIYAPCDIPSFRRSTVDGYAVLAADTAGAGEAVPAFLKQTGAVSMGKQADIMLNSGECAYVPTGGMLPAGADAVVMAEYAEAAGEDVAVYEAQAHGMGMVEVGEDLRNGELLLRRGTLIRPQEAGALAAAGLCKFQAFVPLSLSIISTGDELVLPEHFPSLGEVRDINTTALKELAKKYGYNVASARVLPDDEARLEAAIKETVSSDAVIISGGSSKGDKDITADVINKVARPGVFTHGLAVKPGKPTILGWDEKSKTLLAGLPGHPVSAMMIFEIIFGSLINTLFNKTPPFPIPARVSCNVPGSPGKTVLQPVVLHVDEEGYLAAPVFGKSGMITTLTRADGYIIIDLNKEGLRNGEQVMVHLI
jgi:molybdopterin molybdotransferase